MFQFQDDIPGSNDLPLKVWHVSAEWVFDSETFNEWMSEEDYAVDGSGKILNHPHNLSVENLDVERQEKLVRKRRKNEASTAINSKRSKNPQHKKSSSASKTMETTQCPVCKITITVKALQRHQSTQHADDAVVFECSLCDYKSKRRETLQSHQWRMHCEPTKKGRPSKRESRQRKRSPFLVSEFQSRHMTTLKTLELNSEIGAKLESVQDDFERTKKENEQRFMSLENAAKQNSQDFTKLKTRISIIESKSKEDELPALTGIPGLLDFLNLNENSTKEEIRKCINLRLMERSTESLVSDDIFSNSKMSIEERQKHVMFFNQASEVILKWKKKCNKKKM